MLVEVLTPKGKEMEVEAETIILPTQSGVISVLPKHAPILSVLKEGKMVIKAQNGVIEKEIEGGILEISKNKATILLKKF